MNDCDFGVYDHDDHDAHDLDDLHDHDDEDRGKTTTDVLLLN